MKFTDRKGREWVIDLNFGEHLRLKGEGTNILELEAQHGGRLKALFEDDEIVMAWMWKIIQTAATGLGVTMDDFFRSMGGLSLEQARRALLEEFGNFTRSPAIRSGLQELVTLEKQVDERTTRAMDRATAHMKKHIKDRLSQLSDENIDALCETELQKRQKKNSEPQEPLPPTTSSEPSGDSPGS